MYRNSETIDRRTLAILFATSMALNLLILLVGHLIDPQTHLFSGEEERIAWSIATGHGFASPFWNLTGPTAWSPPVQPYLMAIILRGWGLGAASQLLIETVNIIFFSGVAVVLTLLANKLYDKKIAILVGGAWAIVPAVFHLFTPFFGDLPYRTSWIYLWDASLATFMFSSILLVTVTLRSDRGLRTYLLYGGLWGIAALVNPAVLAVAPICWYWVVSPLGSKRRALLQLAATAIAFFVVCAPWLARNYLVFHHPVFIRSNFGVEFRVGNVPGSDGTWNSGNEPGFNATEWAKFKRLGETKYSALCLHEALQSIEEQPGRFVMVSLLRFRYFWFGPPVGSRKLPALAFVKHIPLALASLLAFAGVWWTIRMGIRAGWIFFWLLLLYPLICYITFFEQRFRDLIEPELLLLAVFFIYSLAEALRRRRQPLQRAAIPS